MRADAVVISVSRYSMVDKDTGVLNEATNVRYAIASNLLPFADENLKGYKLVKARLDYTDFQNFPEAPAVYEADINFSVTLLSMLHGYKVQVHCRYTRDNEQLTENSIKMVFARMKKHTTLQRLYPHLLRHTFATAYVIQGGDLESLRIYMGHTSLDITQKYLHLANQFGFNTNIYKLDERFLRENRR